MARTYARPLHYHPANRARHDERTLGQRIADTVTKGFGSWRYLIIQTTVFAVWISVNLVAFVKHWDPYPFILLNLALSTQAAYAAPLILLAQNRQEEHDRLRAEADYQHNIEALEILRGMVGAVDLEHPDPPRRLSFEQSMELIETRYGDAIEDLND